MTIASYVAGGDGLEKATLTLGFIPLTDCAPLVIAVEKGHFARYGLNVTLSRQASWANIRDKVAAGVLDGAHMLASMPIATTLGLGEVRQATITALSLDLNGNAITISNGLYRRMAEIAPEALMRRPVTSEALRLVIEADRRAGRPPLTFAMVFPFSTHNYVLRYWLAAGGVDPDRDIRLVVIPPPQMVDELRAGAVDGFCVGEPWNAAAVAQGLGRALITDYEIWNNKPEKVFGVSAEWAERHPCTHRAVLMALLEAAEWLDHMENREDASRILAQPAYVDVSPEVLLRSMTGSYQYGADEAPRPLPDFNVFHRYAATFPWRSHALWLIAQMIRWGQIDEPLDVFRLSESVYRPDLYREAATALGLPFPVSDYKTEGSHAGTWTLEANERPITMGPDRFLDGGRFDPADLLSYLRGFPLHHRKLALDDLAPLKA